LAFLAKFEQQTHPSNSLSMADIFGGVGLPRRSTTICWRSAITSASNGSRHSRPSAARPECVYEFIDPRKYQK
jgi:hypothetical protein